MPKKQYPSVPEVLAHGILLPLAGRVSAQLTEGTEVSSRMLSAVEVMPEFSPFIKIGYAHSNLYCTLYAGSSG